jgi:hypothetical protein
LSNISQNGLITARRKHTHEVQRREGRSTTGTTSSSEAIVGPCQKVVDDWYRAVFAILPVIELVDLWRRSATFTFSYQATNRILCPSLRKSGVFTQFCFSFLRNHKYYGVTMPCLIGMRKKKAPLYTKQKRIPGVLSFSELRCFVATRRDFAPVQTFSIVAGFWIRRVFLRLQFVFHGRIREITCIRRG